MIITQRLALFILLSILVQQLTGCEPRDERLSDSSSSTSSVQKQSPQSDVGIYKDLAKELARNTIALWNSEHAFVIIVVYDDRGARAMGLHGRGGKHLGEPLLQAVRKLSLADKDLDEVRARLRALGNDPELRRVANLIVWGTLRNEVVVNKHQIFPSSGKQKVRTLGGNEIELPFVLGNENAVSSICIRAVEILTGTTAGEDWIWAPLGSPSTAD